MKKHATTEFNDNGINYIVYHKTAVVKFNRDKIILNSGGWETKTTKDRMNATAYENNLPYRVYQKDFEWFVTLDNKCYPFEDGFKMENGYNKGWRVFDIKADEKETKRYYKNIVTQNEGR